MDLSKFDDRFLASFILGGPDYDAQLRAIHGLLRRHRQADEELSKEIKAIEEFAKQASGTANDRAVDEWVDHLHHSVFQDAAHSMAAVGMFAPFLESLFQHAFVNARDFLERHGWSAPDHARWKIPSDQHWDCQYVYPGRRHFVAGVMELAAITGLSDFLPAGLKKTLDALFGYRNKMLHLGFEWPQPERLAFAKAIAANDWEPSWFSKATSGGEPWIFYLSQSFIDHCLATIDDILNGLGAFVRQKELGIASED